MVGARDVMFQQEGVMMMRCEVHGVRRGACGTVRAVHRVRSAQCRCEPAHRLSTLFAGGRQRPSELLKRNRLRFRLAPFP